MFFIKRFLKSHHNPFNNSADLQRSNSRAGERRVDPMLASFTNSLFSPKSSTKRPSAPEVPVADKENAGGLVAPPRLVHKVSTPSSAASERRARFRGGAVSDTGRLFLVTVRWSSLDGLSASLFDVAACTVTETFTLGGPGTPPREWAARADKALGRPDECNVQAWHDFCRMQVLPACFATGRSSPEDVYDDGEVSFMVGAAATDAKSPTLAEERVCDISTGHTSGTAAARPRKRSSLLTRNEGKYSEVDLELRVAEETEKAISALKAQHADELAAARGEVAEAKATAEARHTEQLAAVRAEAAARYEALVQQTAGEQAAIMANLRGMEEAAAERDRMIFMLEQGLEECDETLAHQKDRVRQMRAESDADKAAAAKLSESLAQAAQAEQRAAETHNALLTKTQKMSDQLIEANKSCEAAKLALTDCRGEANALGKRLGEEQERCKQYSRLVKKTEQQAMTQISSSKDAVREARDATKQSEAENRTLRASLQEAKHQAGKVEMELSRTAQETCLLKTRCEEARKELDAANARLAKAASDENALKASVDVAVAELAAEKAKQDTAVAAARAERDEQAEKLRANLKEALDAKHQANTQTRDLRVLLQAAKAEVASQKAQVAQLANDCAELVKALEEAQ